jgi:hypothetical protein
MVILVAICVGCSSSPPVPQLATIAPPQSDKPGASALALYPAPAVGMEAAVVGTLRVIDGCLGVGDSHSLSAVLVFPEGEASLRDSGLTWRGGTYPIGDDIDFGGGGGDASYIAYLPAGCAGVTPFFVGS